MPVAMDWDTPERRVIRITFFGEWDVNDMHRMITKRNSMMECVPHHVHQILDMTASASEPGNLLSIMHRAPLPTDKRGSLIVMVNASRYIQSIINMMQNLSPIAFEAVTFVDNLDDAYARITGLIAKSA